MMQLQPNTLFHNRFFLLELKGRGTFGEVWLARDEQLDLEVALKIYIALDDRGVADFKSEYCTTFGLSHPNLLHAYHFDLCDNRPYLVMPYCPDSSVSLIGRVDETTLWRFIHDVASGLAYLHKMNIIHHDIKPDNVLIDKYGNFLVTDFGISTQLRSTLQRNSLRDVNNVGTSGSMPYMAPELFDLSAGAVFASDVWALGATLYELASGELPFFGQGGAMLLKGALMSRPNLPYSEELIDTIIQCLAKEPWERPTAKLLVERAHSVIDGNPHGENHDSEKGSKKEEDNQINNDDNPANVPITHSKNKKVWFGVLLALLLVGGGFVLRDLISHENQTNDKDYFAYCKEHPTIENYRSYLARYPQGEFVDLANNWINKWEADSSAKAKFKTANDESRPSENVENMEGKRETKKKERQREQGNSSNSEGKIPTDDDWNRGSDIVVPSNPEQGLTPSNPCQRLNPAGGLKQGELAPPDPEEEAYQRTQRNGATIDDCCAYIEKYSNKGEYFTDVRNTFRQLYAKKYGTCKTYDDYKKFLDEHEGIMKRMRLHGSSLDNAFRNRAETEMNELRPRQGRRL